MHPSAHSLGYWLKAIHAHTWKYPKNVVCCRWKIMFRFHLSDQVGGWSDGRMDGRRWWVSMSLNAFPMKLYWLAAARWPSRLLCFVRLVRIVYEFRSGFLVHPLNSKINFQLVLRITHELSSVTRSCRSQSSACRSAQCKQRKYLSSFTDLFVLSAWIDRCNIFMLIQR